MKQTSSSILDLKFKKEVRKMLKKLRKTINKNKDPYSRELETMKMKKIKNRQLHCQDKNQSRNNQ